MDGAAVEQIAGLSRKPTEMSGFLLRPDDWIVDDPAALIKPGPSAKPLTVSALGAVRDYITANKDHIDLGRVVVHVASPSVVHVLGPLDVRSRSREGFVTATAGDLLESFLGRFMALEDFLIGVQVRFQDREDRGRVLALLSNVKHESVKTALDDGVTQIVQARAGVALVSDVAVPNPVQLCAYRSFREIAQPSALFVVRVQAGKSGELPSVALFEADGGAWRLTAVDRVRDWLVEALPTISVLA